MKKAPSLAKMLRLTGMFAVATILLSFAGACQLLNDDPDQQEKEPEDRFDFIKRNNAQKFGQPPVTHPDEIINTPPGDIQKKLGETADQLSDDLRRPAPVDPPRFTPAPRFYEDLIVLDADEKVNVLMTFNATPLVDVLPAFADVLGFNFAVDSEVKSTVTLNLNSTMTRRELWETFEKLLAAAGCGAIRSGQLVRVMPQNKLLQQPELRVRNRADGSSEVLCYALQHSVSREILNQLRTFLSREGAMVDMSRQNMILICDNSANIRKMKEILDLVDQPGRLNWPRAVLLCNNVKPSKIATELQEILPVVGLPVNLVTDRTDLPGSIKLSGIDRLQLLVATAATTEALQQLRKWVEILDNADASDQERVYVYKVVNGKARDLAQALSIIFTTQGSALTIDANSGNNRTEQINSQATRQLNTTITAANRNSTNVQVNTQIDRDSNLFDQPVRIFADGVNNRLVIRTSSRTYAMIKALLDRLDIVPAQVLLQVLVIEVQLSNGNQFGLEFSATASNGSNVDSLFGTNYNNLAKDSTTAEGFKMAIFNPKNPDEKFGYIKALAGRNKTKVISSPQLLVTGHTKATIQVGSDVPIITGDITSTDSSNNSLRRTYQYRETGIILNITPQITSNNMISLEVKQEVSEAVKNTTSSATDTPVINQRLLETSMTLANGKTMIIGGMIQEKDSDSLSSVPLLADVPFLGRLFGNTEQEVNRTEMLVLITGYIVDEKSPVEEMIKRYNDAVRAASIFESDIIDHGKGHDNLHPADRQNRRVSARVVPADGSADNGGDNAKPAEDTVKPAENTVPPAAAAARGE